jgi:hypothetical protein
LANKLSTADMNWRAYHKQSQEFEERYRKERSVTIRLDAEVENLREQLRKANTFVERYKQVNESLEGMVRSYHEYAFPSVSEK